ncbi:hypothetical protein C0992_003838 [Termitomyces sp. T32_za158]|nr:hypothetical protein C0992_003838 [Termitomyces sp. T32_za158]
MGGGPTPKPLTIRPTTNEVRPVEKVWNVPPIVKITLPKKSVPLRPSISPTRPAATEVTVAVFRQGTPDRQTYAPNAPISSTETIVPISIGPGVPK